MAASLGGNRVSDTVSVIDADPTSATHHQVIATIQSVDETSVILRRARRHRVYGR